MTQCLAQKTQNSVTPHKSWPKIPKSVGRVEISFSLIELYQASFDQREAAAVVATPRRSKTPQTTQTELPSHSQMGFFSRGILMNLGNEKTTRIAISLANGVGHGLSFFFFTPNIFIRIRKCKEYSQLFYLPSMNNGDWHQDLKICNKWTILLPKIWPITICCKSECCTIKWRLACQI